MKKKAMFVAIIGLQIGVVFMILLMNFTNGLKFYKSSRNPDVMMPEPAEMRWSGRVRVVGANRARDTLDPRFILADAAYRGD